MVSGKEKPSLPRTAFPSNPDGILYLDKSAAKDGCYACQPSSGQSDDGRIAIWVIAIKRPIFLFVVLGWFQRIDIGTQQFV